jgi:hypothetical protein
MKRTAGNERLTPREVNNPSLQFARTTQVKNLQDSLQMASEERNELKQSVLTLKQEKLEWFMNLSNLVKGECAQFKSELHMASKEREELKQSVITLKQEKLELLIDLSKLKEDCTQLKSELTNVKKDCESSIAALKEEVASRTTQGPVVQPVNQYIWKTSKDVCVSGIHHAELLECPPMTSGVHKWTIFVEQHTNGYVCLGVASTVHSFATNNYIFHQEGGWSYDSGGEACHNGYVVKENLPEFKKGSQVTFLLDLTGDGTLSASVDGTSFHQLFSDMHSKVRSVNPEGGFVPAIDLNRSDQKVRVRFLGFESGQDEKERL